MGIFAVKKKNDEQRLLLDCRHASCHFTDPPKVHLASGAAFASIGVEPGQQVYLGNVDIKVAFYAMELPGKLLKHFGLPHDVRAADVGITQLAGLKTPPRHTHRASVLRHTHGLNTFASSVPSCSGRTGATS